MVVCHVLSISRFLCFARVKILLAVLWRVPAFSDRVVDRHVKVGSLSGFALRFLFAI